MATGPALTVPGEAPGPGSRPGPSSAGPLSMFLRNRPRRGHRDPTAPYLLASLPISPRGASDPWGALKTERLLVWWSPERVARSLFSQWLRLCPLSPPSLTGLPQRPGATTPPPATAAAHPGQRTPRTQQGSPCPQGLQTLGQRLPPRQGSRARVPGLHAHWDAGMGRGEGNRSQRGTHAQSGSGGRALASSPLGQGCPCWSRWPRVTWLDSMVSKTQREPSGKGLPLLGVGGSAGAWGVAGA